MRRNLIHFAVAVAVVLGGGTLAIAGGSKCAEQHAQADHQKKADKMAAEGWLGIETEKNASGAYVVEAVAEGSPAEEAGFQVGDVLVSLNGVKLSEDNKDAIYKVKSTLGPGKAVTYRVARAGSEREIRATLAEVSREVLAAWTGEHAPDGR